ncbi:MAG: hypothetical protein H6747_12835 [Deltaproteobacteria bacterium]|nr:hypothetical protein [Deltaproteobacteria bacterium]
MLGRLLLAAIVAAFAALLYRSLQPHPLRRIPWRWRRLAMIDGKMARALTLRRSMVKLVLAGKANDAAALMHDVDRVIASLATAIDARTQVAALPDEAQGQTGAATQASIDAALRQVEAAHGHLVDIARAEIDAAVGEVRTQLADHTEQLRLEVEARQEVETMLREQDAGGRPVAPEPPHTD